MSRRIGVVVVHGIGEQPVNETVRSLLCGLRRGFHLPDLDGVSLDDWCSKKKRNAGVEMRREPLELILPDRAVRFYEAHWASELEGPATHGSFNFKSLPMVACFPWLNESGGLYPSGTYPKGWGYLWTIVLLPLLGPLWLMLKGVDKSFNFLVNSVLERDVTFESTLDETAGDVVNYVKSRAKTHQDPNYIDVAGRICAHFHEKMRQASEECSEIWIVSHSLGTVVAYDSLTGATLQTADEDSTSGVEPFGKLERLYTLGSPLEKVMFFWPNLLGTSLLGRVLYERGDPKRIQGAHEGRLPKAFRWYNFHHRADLVAGKLANFDRWGQVENCHISGGGGIIRSHTLYYSHPAVHEVLGTELLGPHVARRPVSNRLRDSLSILAENLFAFVVGAFCLIVGLIALGFTLIGPVVGIALAFEDVSWDEPAGKIAVIMIAGTVLFILGGAFRLWLRDVKNQHKKYRQPGRA